MSSRVALFRRSDGTTIPLYVGIGVLWLLVLFSHEAVITMEAQAGHVAMTPPIARAVADDADPPETRSSVYSATSRHRPGHTNPPCDTLSPVLPLQSSGFLARIVPPPIAAPEPAAVAVLSRDLALEPVVPPHVRRAFLQVYLI